MAVKIDMSKAHDRVEWDFLVEAMKKLGFAEKWIKLIMMYMCYHGPLCSFGEWGTDGVDSSN